MKIVCAITMGDPAGIGPEITLNALKNPSVAKLANFIIVGDAYSLARHCEFRRRRTKQSFIEIIDLNNISQKNFAFGKVRAEYGRASMEYLDVALELIRTHKAGCLVTAPINKEAVSLAGYKAIGHTEYIANFFNVRNAVMMLFNRKIRVSLVTDHIPLRNVPRNLNQEKILAVIKNTNGGLKAYFSIKKPRLGCCGLNPHASDNGVLGDEEKRIISPALKKAKMAGINIDFVSPADTIFIPSKKNFYDAIICMYHDQGLIPLKMSGLDSAVNITLGLPFIRTSPGHGTAFNISGKNSANPSAMIQAIKSAILCAKNLKKD